MNDLALCTLLSSKEVNRCVIHRCVPKKILVYGATFGPEIKLDPENVEALVALGRSYPIPINSLESVIGKVDFTVRHLSSSTMAFPSTFQFSSGQPCVVNGRANGNCSAYDASPSSETTWTQRSTFPEYIVALTTIVGSALFAIFGGVGIACLPLGLIFALKKAADALNQEERSGSKGRKWRKNMKAVEKECPLVVQIFDEHLIRGMPICSSELVQFHALALLHQDVAFVFDGWALEIADARNKAAG
ncbi:hypothetical protein CTI12_AA393720 [Artemisia annua]|uniref:Uncharacterized protein n=1 Tax=Artemisia annua TaxID=35608 RepID=A0A2U1MD04_ARTAN|nr:hypothetical protein CTI12_AA393720 [Artemisia annua]